jgi:RNA polymerase sigma-70 factor (ECF subfamily)
LEAGLSAGNESAETRIIDLMDRHETPIYRFLVALTANRDAARDCTQDTFVRALEQLRRGRDVNAQWLYKVARNRAIDEFRRGRKERPDLGMMTAIPGAGWSAPEERVAIAQAFAALSPGDRAALFLYSVEGMGADELAAALGIRESAVRMRLSRARERFRRAYGGRR